MGTAPSTRASVVLGEDCLRSDSRGKGNWGLAFLWTPASAPRPRIALRARMLRHAPGGGSRKGLPCALKIYEGEQHGFRKAENIEDSLNSELYFYSKVFGFECAGDDVKPFPIDNLP